MRRIVGLPLMYMTGGLLIGLATGAPFDAVLGAQSSVVPDRTLSSEVKADPSQNTQRRDSQQHQSPAPDALHKVITLNLNNQSLLEAIRHIQRLADVGFVFPVSMFEPITKRITLQAPRITVSEALKRVLEGTGIDVLRDTSGMISFGAPKKRRSDQQETVKVFVSVIDSATRKGIAGVTLLIVGTKLSGVTKENGGFQFFYVPSGSYSLSAKMLGYESRVVQFTAGSDQQTPLVIILRQTSTTLSEVVTTATGIQRRVEVGNDIVSINVDSVMRVMPVSTLSDLLATRVPGMTVTPTSGAPGAPSRIRIRGVSSINTTNDPIVILDGIRMYAAQIEASFNKAKGSSPSYRDRLVPSPVDQIDPNIIEKLEVLKGPSAVALYGTDAANGVIVITTKRGKAGPLRWSADGIWGQERIPGTWATNYWRYGSPAIQGDAGSKLVRHCPRDIEIQPSYSGKCIPDSLVTYQILNDPATTVFGTGSTRTYRFNVSGGAGGLTYAFSGSTQREVGVVKIPDLDVQLLREAGTTVPEWQRRPQQSEGQNGSMNVQAELGRSAMVTFTTILGRTWTQTTPFQDAINIASRMPPAGFGLGTSGLISGGGDVNAVAVGSGLLGAISTFRERGTSQSLRSSNALTAEATALQRVRASITAGIDVTSRRDQSSLGRGECFTAFGGGCSGQGKEDGSIYTSRGLITETTLNTHASMPIAFGKVFSLQTSLGGNYRFGSTDEAQTTALGIAVGATSGDAAEIRGYTETHNASSVAGIFVETRLGIADRFYLPLSLRTDAGSGLGPSVRPTFPRLAFSYLLSEQPLFRALPVLGRIGNLRLRTAYGQAGVQPGVGQRLRTYGTGVMSINERPVMFTDLATIGNTLLRPERTKEWEWGLDADLMQDRLQMTMTWFRKQRIDALIELEVPPSVNGGGMQAVNIGNVAGHGGEWTLDAAVLRNQLFGWNLQLNFSRERNRLVKLGRNSPLINENGSGTQTRFVEGYPLFGQWARSIEGYADVNGDGWISAGGDGIPNEVQLSEGFVYLGNSDPDFQTSLHSTMTMFNRITIGTTFHYLNGITQQMTTLVNGVTDRWTNDPTVPLATQAYFAAAEGGVCSSGGLRAGKRCSGIGITQTVSLLRVTALSVGYIVPPSFTKSLLHGRSVRLQLQGTNLGLWTNYRGKDPQVNAVLGEVLRDPGVVPTPRKWQFVVGIN